MQEKIIGVERQLPILPPQQKKIYDRIKNYLNCNNNLNNFFCITLISIIFIIIFSAPCILFNKVYLNYFSKSAIIQNSAIFFLILFLAIRIYRKDYRIYKNLLIKPIAIFIFLAVLSLFYAIDKYKGIMAIGDLFFAFLFFLIISNSFRDRKTIKTILIAIFIAGFFTAILGISQYLFDVKFISQATPPAATFANKNMAAQFIVLSLPIGIVFFIKSAHKKYNKFMYFFFIANFIIIVFLICCKTQAAWVASISQLILLIITLFFAKIFNLKTSTKKFFATILIIFTLFFMFNFNENMKNNAQNKQQKKVDSGTIRLYSWEGALKLIKHNFLFGVGFGNFGVAFPYYNQAFYLKFEGNQAQKQEAIEGYQMERAHNDYLEIFSQLGLFGFLSFLFIVFVLLKMFLKKDNFSYETLAIFLSLSGIMINAFFSFPMQLPVPLFIIMTLLALIPSENNNNAKKYITFKESHFACLLFFSAIFFIVILNFHDNNEKYRRSLSKMNSYFSKSQWNGVIAEAGKAIKYNSYQKDEQKRLGIAYANLNKRQKALKIFQNLEKIRPNDLGLLINLGNAYLKTGDKFNAIKSYEKASYLKPRLIKSIHNIAIVYMKDKKFKTALKYLSKAIKIDPKNSIILSDIGLIKIETKKYNEALSYLFKSIKADKNNARAYNRAGVAFYYLKDYQSAATYTRQAVALSPNDKNFKNNFRIFYNKHIGK